MLLTLFLIAFSISLLGSLPIGLITLAITERSITKGFKAGFILGLGATVMEFVYTYLAISCLDILTENIQIGRNIKIVSLAIFLFLGIMFLLKKSKPSSSSVAKQDYLYLEFIKGIGVGAMNFLIIPFWLFIGIWLQSHNIKVIDIRQITIFSIAAALGALVVFIGYGKLAFYISKRLDMVTKYTNNLVGGMFLILAAIQAAQLI